MEHATPATAALAALLHALERFMAGGLDPDPDAAALLGRNAGRRAATAERRRHELIAAAVADDGWTQAFAELVHDTAAEEGLEPAFAFELVRSGVGVRDLDAAPDHRSAATEAMVMAEPASEPISTAAGLDASGGDQRLAVREGRLRAAFRRLRRIAELGGKAADALAVFAAAPDVDRCEY